jgi:hypothetical protein
VAQKVSFTMIEKERGQKVNVSIAGKGRVKKNQFQHAWNGLD